MPQNNKIKEIISAIENRISPLLKEKSPVIIAIDGRCASGKTTLAKALSEHFPCNVFHMDDFFLRPSQKNAERLLTPGENIDHERFLSEVLLPLTKGDSFSYRPYDCHAQDFSEPVSVQPKALAVVEGVYSCHSALYPYYDMHILLDIDAEYQRERLLHRSGKEMLKRFTEHWIPLEEAYFSACDLHKKCELYFKA